MLCEIGCWGTQKGDIFYEPEGQKHDFENHVVHSA